MPSLTILMMPNRPLALPMAYNEKLHGFLYSCWEKPFPALHDRGFSQFTFGRIHGKHERTGTQIVFSGPIDWEVRSPRTDLIAELANRLYKDRAVKIDNSLIEVTDFNMTAAPVFSSGSVQISMLSPLTCHVPVDERHDRCLEPYEPDFFSQIQKNALRKAEEYEVICEQSLQISPIENRLKKVPTSFKGTRITGWMGRFLLEAPPKLLSLLYDIGLGDRNSNGFGMFSVVQ